MLYATEIETVDGLFARIHRPDETGSPAAGAAEVGQALSGGVPANDDASAGLSSGRSGSAADGADGDMDGQLCRGALTARAQEAARLKASNGASGKTPGIADEAGLAHAVIDGADGPVRRGLVRPPGARAFSAEVDAGSA